MDYPTKRHSQTALPRKYTVRASKPGYIPAKKTILVGPGEEQIRVEVSLQRIDKSSLKHENERLRGIIVASTSLQKINSCVSKSNSLIELAPQHFKKNALKEFRKTAKTAHKRIEESRSVKRKIAAKISGRDLGGSLETSSSRKPLV